MLQNAPSRRVVLGKVSAFVLKTDSPSVGTRKYTTTAELWQEVQRNGRTGEYAWETFIEYTSDDGTITEEVGGVPCKPPTEAGVPAYRLDCDECIDNGIWTFGKPQDSKYDINATRFVCSSCTSKLNEEDDGSCEEPIDWSYHM